MKTRDTNKKKSRTLYYYQYGRQKINRWINKVYTIIENIVPFHNAIQLIKRPL